MRRLSTEAEPALEMINLRALRREFIGRSLAGIALFSTLGLGGVAAGNFIAARQAAAKAPAYDLLHTARQRLASASPACAELLDVVDPMALDLSETPTPVDVATVVADGACQPRYPKETNLATHFYRQRAVAQYTLATARGVPPGTGALVYSGAIAAAAGAGYGSLLLTRRLTQRAVKKAVAALPPRDVTHASDDTPWYVRGRVWPGDRLSHFQTGPLADMPGHLARDVAATAICNDTMHLLGRRRRVPGKYIVVVPPEGKPVDGSYQPAQLENSFYPLHLTPSAGIAEYRVSIVPNEGVPDTIALEL